MVECDVGVGRVSNAEVGVSDDGVGVRYFSGWWSVFDIGVGVSNAEVGVPDDGVGVSVVLMICVC